MANLIEPRTLPGFRDFFGKDLAIRRKVVGILTQIFEKYGFEPLETPSLEYKDILVGKYGQEAEKLIFLFSDRGEREIGLRYDLTVPTSRVVAQYPTLPKPFKRYQIQPAWRSEKPQKGRYREFTQCDIDIFGSTSPLSDAEIIAIIYESLKALDFSEFTIRINSREILFQIMDQAGLEKDKFFSAIQSIDKLDKKTEEEIRVELAEKYIPNKVVDNIFEQIKLAQPNDNLLEIFSLLEKMSVNEKYFKFDPTLSRGLDYYTGAIFESVVTTPKIGSITGGGRYDNLIGQFTGTNIPAVGTSFGLDRLCDVISELNLWPDIKTQPTKVLVTIFSPDLLSNSLDIVRELRAKNINAEIYLDANTNLDKQLKYADAKGIPFAVIIGPDEVDRDVVTLKNLQTQKQATGKLGKMVELMND